MKNHIALVLAAVLLTGCAGLNFSYSLSYNMPEVACKANTLMCANPTIVAPAGTALVVPLSQTK